GEKDGGRRQAVSLCPLRAGALRPVRPPATLPPEPQLKPPSFPVTEIEDPPSRGPAVNSNGRRRSVLPGSGFAPIFCNSAAMYSLASLSPFDPASRPSKRGDASVSIWAFVVDGACACSAAAATTSAETAKTVLCVLCGLCTLCSICVPIMTSPAFSATCSSAPPAPS